VLREINDLVQYDKELNRKIRFKLAEAEKLAKEMSIELVKAVPDYHLRWPVVPANVVEFREKKRKDPGYVYYFLE